MSGPTENDKLCPVGLARRILVVDDDVETAQAMADMLVHLGHIPVICHSAQEALTRFRQDAVDLLLIDYRMPELTGLDLVALLRSENCQTPVVIMTGHLATEERVAQEKLSIAAVLRKPVGVEALQNALAQADNSVISVKAMVA